VSACVLDTDVLIAALDRADARHGAAARALRTMLGDGTSSINDAGPMPIPRSRAASRAIAGLAPALR
jgi:hypothetical protein